MYFKGGIRLKKLLTISTILFLTINFVGCSDKQNTQDSIYEKIHELYYNIKSYKAHCTVTAYTKAGSNSYDCTVHYNCNDKTFSVVSENTKIFISDKRCVISNGENTIETPASKEDMYIFVNTFFKSYYECEDTVVSVNANQDTDFILLECSVINPTRYLSFMKLSINKKDITPHKLQIFDADGAINTQVEFKEFKFTD